MLEISVAGRCLFLSDIPLVTHLAIFFTHEVTLTVSLEHGNNFGKSFVTQVLKLTQDTSTEEHLGITNPVLVLFQLHGR